MQVAICCSQEQIHNFEFVRERPSEQYVNLDSDDEDTSNLELPHIGNGLLFKYSSVAYLFS